MVIRAVTYLDYLQGENWNIIREEVLKRDNFRCLICNLAAEQVHHLKYSKDILEGKNCSMLISVCRSCHYKCHHDYNGNKLGPKDSSKKTMRLLFGRMRRGYSNPQIGIGMAKLSQKSIETNLIVASRIESLRLSNL